MNSAATKHRNGPKGQNGHNGAKGPKAPQGGQKGPQKGPKAIQGSQKGPNRHPEGGQRPQQKGGKQQNMKTVHKKGPFPKSGKGHELQCCSRKRQQCNKIGKTLIELILAILELFICNPCSRKKSATKPEMKVIEKPSTKKSEESMTLIQNNPKPIVYDDEYYINLFNKHAKSYKAHIINYEPVKKKPSTKPIIVEEEEDDEDEETELSSVDDSSDESEEEDEDILEDSSNEEEDEDDEEEDEE
jgi:hypothetical protein